MKLNQSSCARLLAVGLLCLSFTGCAYDHLSEITIPLSDKFSDIQERVISKTCAISGCHSQEDQKALLSLVDSVSYRNLLNHKIENEEAVLLYRALVVPGKPDSSFLYQKIAGRPPVNQGEQMPQRLNPLSQSDINAIKSWILRGAPND